MRSMCSSSGDSLSVSAHPASGAASPGRETQRALADVVRLATRAVAGCEAASLTLLHDGLASTAAATNDRVRRVDGAQYACNAGPCLDAIRSAVAVRVSDYGTEGRWPEVAGEAVRVGIGSSLSVPLVIGGQALGGLNLYAGAPAAFGADGTATAQVLARHAARALDYLRRYQDERVARAREHEIAAALQRALLPAVSSLPGVDVAARYLSPSASASVGGDWYDVFALPDGAVGLAVGDVMGHDMAAAAAMGQLRSVLRSYAYEGISPSLVLDRMDRLVQGLEMAQLATALYGRLILDGQGGMLVLSNAGHLPPLVRRRDGMVELIERAQSPLIGAPVAEPYRRPEAAVDLERGAVVLLYTDGLVEGRRRALDEGLDQLAATVAAHPGDAPLDDLCDAVVAALDAEGSDDDVALLAVRIA
ncbi:MAG: PP2C family protein-serine/threonine phosphatase [Frankiaceae bacterium]